MQKFKIEKQESGGGDELLDAFNDELDAMRGEDSPEEDGLLQDVSNQYRFGAGRTDVALEALEDEVEEPEEEDDELDEAPRLFARANRKTAVLSSIILQSASARVPHCR